MQMRAMAILYIGPHLNPDFATDYHISPILTPPQLLAQFPPLLMQCGEKDPFVDDTIIFAGRVREAKRQRKLELRQAIRTQGALDEGRQQQMQRELEKLEGEMEEDWVQLQLYSDWSHGYLQMPTLMREARTAINDIADWIDNAFGSADGADSPTAFASESTADVSASSSFRHAESSIMSCLWPWGKKAQENGHAPHEETRPTSEERRTTRVVISTPKKGDAGRTGANPRSLLSETETETENDEGITFVPKARRPSAGAKASSGSDETVNGLAKSQDSPRAAVEPSRAVMNRSSNVRTSSNVEREQTGKGNGRGSGNGIDTRAAEFLAGYARQERGSSRIVKSGAGAEDDTQRARGGESAGARTEEQARTPDREDVSEGRASRALTRSPKGVESGRSRTPARGGPVSTAGQTISESELMRRRRLLDSHIFASDS